MELKKRILVTPLNWGLGHSTRCIPIINALLKHNFEPIIGSDGVALALLKKEFPNLKAVELPSYDITYSKKAKHFKYKMIKDAPKTLMAIKAENKLIKGLVSKGEIQGIISDNRLGVRSKKVPSVFITHQLNVLSGNTTWISSRMHQRIIKKFDECWVPDLPEEPNLSGKLGHLKNSKLKIKYIGAVSRFELKEVPQNYDLLVLLSGPEPQRTLLEQQLLSELQLYKGKSLLVKGIIEDEQIKEQKGNVEVVNFMIGKELELVINKSKMVLSRSGYTTILDLAKLEKRAFFIPTPGQFEQEYLAKRLKDQGMVPYSNQKEFKMSDLDRISNYTGFLKLNTKTDYKSLFQLFERE